MNGPGLVCACLACSTTFSHWALLVRLVRIRRRAPPRLGRALGDPTRLRALKLIAARPRTTQELAPLVGISEAGLSKHLRLLARAGVVESHREGYYVVYTLAADRIAPLSDALLRFLA
jgi:DNA-binding transcriptional ArsR family regulator